MHAYGEQIRKQMLLHASLPSRSALLVCNQLTALTWKHASVWRHTRNTSPPKQPPSLSLFFPFPASFSFGSLEAQPPLLPAIYLGTTSAKMGQGRPSFSSTLFFFSPSLALLIATHLWHLSVRLRARATFRPTIEKPQ